MLSYILVVVTVIIVVAIMIVGIIVRYKYKEARVLSLYLSTTSLKMCFVFFQLKTKRKINRRVRMYRRIEFKCEVMSGEVNKKCQNEKQRG